MIYGVLYFMYSCRYFIIPVKIIPFLKFFFFCQRNDDPLLQFYFNFGQGQG
jgi:hypothetical protein